MGSSARLAVKVTPKASRTEVGDWTPEGLLRIKVQAPPEDGLANAAVCELLAQALGLPKRSVTLVQGASSRQKQIQIEGLTLEQVRERLRP